MSKLLVGCCRLATEQYLQGVADPNYDGAIASLDSYFPQLDRYEQIATFQAERERSWIEPVLKRTALKDIIPKTNLIYHGYLLRSEKQNIIVFRGTQEPEEWIANINAQQREYRSSRFLFPVQQTFSVTHQKSDRLKVVFYLTIMLLSR